VRIQTSIYKRALLVPQSAVSEVQGGYEVAVVGSNGKASIRGVSMGEKTGKLWIIEEGVKGDEKVVVEGKDKVREGTPVNAKPVDLSQEGR
jgi:membrane fusion protein (multidrug efflux system)